MVRVLYRLSQSGDICPAMGTIGEAVFIKISEYLEIQFIDHVCK